MKNNTNLLKKAVKFKNSSDYRYKDNTKEELLVELSYLTIYIEIIKHSGYYESGKLVRIKNRMDGYGGSLMQTLWGCVVNRSYDTFDKLIKKMRDEYLSDLAIQSEIAFNQED